LDTAYRSFGGEVEASSTPTICRLPDSRRHQLWAIALLARLTDTMRSFANKAAATSDRSKAASVGGLFHFQAGSPSSSNNGRASVSSYRGNDETFENHEGRGYWFKGQPLPKPREVDIFEDFGKSSKP
jgi:hypothetical protein